MKCPKCEEEMKEGYIHLDIDFGSVYWSKTKPQRIGYRKGFVTVMRFNPLLYRGRENWLRRAYRCEMCGLLTFEEKYNKGVEHVIQPNFIIPSVKELGQVITEIGRR